MIQSRIVRRVVERQRGNLKNVSYQNINDVLELAYKQSGKSIDLGEELIAIREHGEIRIIKEVKTESYSLELELGSNKIVECNKKIELSLLEDVKNKQRYENTYTKNIDYDKINGSLKVRNRQSGDRIILKNGSKKLKDFLIDEKVPKTSRDDIVVIADDINVIWVVGYRLSQAYYITNQTKHVLQIQIEELSTLS